MEYSFSRYLLAKQSVDDRALNKDVLSALEASLPDKSLSIIEVGGGIGTMLTRLLRWDVISQAEYVLVDEMAENIEFTTKWLPEWAGENGLHVENLSDEASRGVSSRRRPRRRGGRLEQYLLRLFDEKRDILVKLVCADVFDFVAQNPASIDLLIAHAFLDLLPMPESLPKLFTLTKNLAWLTVNFDGVTSFEPTIDRELDARIERLYHETMDARPGGGDSLSGRHLFEHLKQAGAEIEAAGSSDWVVYPVDGQYPNDEAYFLQFILHFFEESLSGNPSLNAAAFENWLSLRRKQIEQAELVYIAHQIDFLVKVKHD